MGAGHDKEADIVQRSGGNQPPGHMTWIYTSKILPGYPTYGCIEMFFEFEDGIQTEKHPNPGKPYYGLKTKAYLPDNSAGRKAVTRLKKAFDHKAVFTLARNSRGEEEVVIGDIPLKTRDDTAGPKSLCYPDAMYPGKLKKLLKSRGYV